MATYIDLLITDDDISTDTAGQPLLVTDRDVIAQDTRHAIRESGLLTKLIGQRDSQQRALVRKQIRQVVESDSRIKPGTSAVTEYFATTKNVQITVTAETEFGLITVGA
ncbi:DUF2590 family protein [Oceanobacter sp. 4_MG-2023]|uniref:DUF2590 family protein n=1 Tax=Oceanobacter sp. 4_MG-2023 TaxID=3062623 RepID=UPI0027344E80|nr:DUF2590 family protein [Oceanobacter sp. 4_MG-2023]MDP2548903.1 DUF2590 family protein [Oceanobacter sp. 4_MG-2023]